MKPLYNTSADHTQLACSQSRQIELSQLDENSWVGLTIYLRVTRHRGIEMITLRNAAVTSVLARRSDCVHEK